MALPTVSGLWDIGDMMLVDDVDVPKPQVQLLRQQEQSRGTTQSFIKNNEWAIEGKLQQNS